MKLHLGVVDIPYGDASKKGAAKSDRSITTGDVAEILEDNYGIMEYFYNIHKNEIDEWILDSFENAIESIDAGGNLSFDAFGRAAQKIQARFDDFLSNKEMDGLIPGVPTQASLDNVSHRFKKRVATRKRPKKKKVKAGPRPSFIDTGLYQNTFRAWIDDGEEDR